MAETPAPAPATPESPAAPPALKKGALVRVSKEAYLGSCEALASDAIAPDYIFEGPAEILAVNGDYAQVRWSRPVPDSWLRLDQLLALG